MKRQKYKEYKYVVRVVVWILGGIKNKKFKSQILRVQGLRRVWTIVSWVDITLYQRVNKIVLITKLFKV